VTARDEIAASIVAAAKMADFKPIFLITPRILSQDAFGGQWKSTVYQASIMLFIEQHIFARQTLFLI
jgi:hypothetical protein